MKFRYEGPNKIRKKLNRIAEAILITYAVLGNFYNLATKTGHPSADIATGRSQPTQLEKMFSEYGKALVVAGETYLPVGK